MAIDLDFFKKVQSTDSWDKDDYIEEKENIADGLRTSSNYIPNAMINNKTAELVVTGTDDVRIVKVIAFPDVKLVQGDYITFDHKTAIVTEVMAYQPFQVVAVATLCNFTFKWQDFNGNIVEKIGVYSSSYNSTNSSFSGKVKGENYPYIYGEMRMYLPYDNDTKYLFIDKRLAIGTTYDKSGKEILKVNKIIGSDFSACNDVGGHLVVFNLKVDNYNELTDNKELMICDYISPAENNDNKNTNINGVITGRKTIPLGSTRKYTITYTNDNNEQIDDIETNWDIETDIVDYELTQKSNSIEIFIPDNEFYIGKQIKIIAKYNNTIDDITTDYIIEVVAI